MTAIFGIIFFGMALTLVALICGTIIAIVKIRQSSLSPSKKEAKTDEARLIQEIYLGLTEMEKRIETLETILMDPQEKKGTTYEHETK